MIWLKEMLRRLWFEAFPFATLAPLFPAWVWRQVW
jgi:hypothetical protein